MPESGHFQLVLICGAFAFVTLTESNIYRECSCRQDYWEGLSFVYRFQTRIYNSGTIFASRAGMAAVHTVVTVYSAGRTLDNNLFVVRMLLKL